MYSTMNGVFFLHRPISNKNPFIWKILLNVSYLKVGIEEILYSVILALFDMNNYNMN